MLEEYQADAAYKKEVSEGDEAALLLSVFYHDIVYQPDRNDNEEQSVHLLERFIGKAQSLSNLKLEEISRRACQLILMTKQHKPQDHLEYILNDLDMSVLAAPSARYELYSGQIKQEYIRMFANELEFNEKRAKFLSSLDPKTVFYLHPGHEETCRRNIEWEMAKLNVRSEL